MHLLTSGLTPINRQHPRDAQALGGAWLGRTAPPSWHGAGGQNTHF